MIGRISRIRAAKDERQAQLVSWDDPTSPEAEAFRSLRTNLQFAAAARPYRSLLVTSSVPGEGKSLVSANLGVVFAQAGKKVLLVDADLRRPTLHKYLRTSNRVGLTNVLVGAHSLSSAIQELRIPGLSFLPSGPVPPNPGELLGSQIMHQLVEQLSNRFDLVFLDTPPVLFMSDARLLAPSVDGALLVVRWKFARRDLVKKAVQLLRLTNTHIYGVVFNSVANYEVNSYYGGYGY
ncbi:MAG: Tyrosine-protein kinase Wzc [Brockia lithotrophica]|uniref:non-specific protein-tyrosine kinase n=1 Tax=Brockia lithotrophica TaxID=933949 RepID=A0A2T5G4U0_9BACL|nr:MAG: Tyrosine-protein kinase Wzc [Brockia lithotrophica]